MALTATCKKCAKEVPPGEICPFCGSRLGKNAAHAAWCLQILPIKDWMSWNAVARVLLPAGLAVLLLALGAEALAGGFAAVEMLMRSGFPGVLLILLAALILALLLVFALQGTELADFVVDSRGIHETRYLPNPTPLTLLLRLKSPRLLTEAEADTGSVQVLKLSERHLPWRDVSRVQLWPEKCVILFYAPSWWLRVPVFCTPFSWGDTLDLIREKLGRKKKIRLPASLTVPPVVPVRKAKPQARLDPEVEAALEQIRLEERSEAGPEASAESFPERSSETEETP